MPDSVPAVLSLLADDQNVAVDAAIVEAIPDLAPEIQRQCVQLLIKRNHTPHLAMLVGRLPRLAAPARELMIRNVRDLFQALRAAIGSTSLDEREGAIALIVLSGSADQSYLLAEALRSTCAHTRDLAGRGLHALAAHVLAQSAATGRGGTSAPPTAVDQVGEALRAALLSWELHFHPKALEATMWMADHLEAVIADKLADHKSRIASMFNGLIEGTRDPRAARFLLRALAMPALQHSASQAVAAADAAMLRAILQESPWLADPRNVRELHRVPGIKLLENSIEPLMTAGAGGEAQAVRFLLALGAPKEWKYTRLRDAINHAPSAFVRAAVLELAHDRSDDATGLLRTIAERGGENAKVAADELKRRGTLRAESRGVPTSPATQASSAGPGPVSWLNRYWSHYDELAPEEREEYEKKLTAHVGEILPAVVRQLGHTQPNERFKAIRLIQKLRAARQAAEPVYATVHDADPMVRSLAVSLLADVPGPVSERLLHAAVNDPDPRVQANAVEAMDKLNLTSRLKVTESKLDSANSRVRANAAKSLLRADLRRAATALLEMLKDDSSAHRVSALWVISRLQLRSTLDRVLQMSRNDPDERIRRRATRILRGLSGLPVGTAPFTMAEPSAEPAGRAVRVAQQPPAVPGV